MSDPIETLLGWTQSSERYVVEAEYTYPWTDADGVEHGAEATVQDMLSWLSKRNYDWKSYSDDGHIRFEAWDARLDSETLSSRCRTFESALEDVVRQAAAIPERDSAVLAYHWHFHNGKCEGSGYAHEHDGVPRHYHEIEYECERIVYEDDEDSDILHDPQHRSWDHTGCVTEGVCWRDGRLT